MDINQAIWYSTAKVIINVYNSFKFFTEKITIYKSTSFKLNSE